ncbi:MAG: hypothetical protein JXB14_03105 [Candidatus Altiarchaeota archaeon]|nr:hypothetical protein [Candidatus Altiarchaeota archaeon]
MKRALIVLAALLALTGLALAQNNTSDETPGDVVGGITDTGGSYLDGIVQFLADASPFLLIAVGIILLVVTSIGKWVGIILIILAIIRLVWMFL